MTKQRETEYIPVGKVVHATRGIATDAVHAATIEQLFAVKGPDTIARLLAARLRDPSPDRAILDKFCVSTVPRTVRTARATAFSAGTLQNCDIGSSA